MEHINNNLRIFTERAHLRNPAITVLMKLTVDGQFNEMQFMQALESLRKVHPLLYSSIHIADDGEAYYMENTVREPELHCARREHVDQWLAIAEAENKKPFDILNGPLIRFYVFYGDNDFDILAAVQHLIGDGNAVARLLHDVVRACAGESLLPCEQRLISSQAEFPEDAAPTFIVKSFVRSMNKSWQRGKHPCFNEQEYCEMFRAYHRLADISLFVSELPKEKVSRLQQLCKAHSATINDALITAFMLAVQAECPYRQNEKMEIGVPVNIRNQLPFPANDSLGNFASAITIACRSNHKKDLWGSIADIQKKLRAKLGSAKSVWVLLNLYALMEPQLIDAMYFAAYGGCDDKAARKAAAMLAINEKPTSTAVSNLGRLDFECQIGTYHIRDFVFFAPKAPSSYLTLGVATMGGSMKLGFSYDKKIVSPADMERINAKILELLGAYE